MITMSLVAAATTFAFGSTADDIADLQKQIDKLKTKQGQINAQSANDNIKWGVDFRTSIDSINYDMANGDSYENKDLLAMRLWLNMAYAPDSHNIFKGQLSMNKAMGADFAGPFGRGGAFTMSNFDWVANEALTDNSLKVRQAYWLYLGDDLFGADIPWTFSLGRRPSTGGFLGNLRNDDAAQSPLAHVIDVEFDGLSSKLDFSNITGIPGMSFKVCMGKGATNATPIFATPTPYAEDENNLKDISLAGFIFEPYNDGQYIVKTTYYKAWNLVDMVNPMDPTLGFEQVGDMEGAAISVLIDGLTEDGYFADAKIFGSFAWTKSSPDNGKAMLNPMSVMTGESETGTSYWFGAQLPVDDEGKGVVGLEYNHGSQYWRPFTYAEDTMIGSKIAARGDAWEAYFTYQLTDALSAQVRYTNINYEYTGSQGFFGGTSGGSIAIDDIKAGADGFDMVMEGLSQAPVGTTPQQAIMGAGMASSPEEADAIWQQLQMAKGYSAQVVEEAQDFRFYLRYRF